MCEAGACPTEPRDDSREDRASASVVATLAALVATETGPAPSNALALAASRIPIVLDRASKVPPLATHDLTAFTSSKPTNMARRSSTEIATEYPEASDPRAGQIDVIAHAFTVGPSAPTS